MLEIGLVTVDPDDASYAGSGLTLALFEAKKPALDAAAAEQVANAGEMIEDAEDALDKAETALAEIEAGGSALYGDGYADILAAAEDRAEKAQEALDNIDASASLVARKVALYTGAVNDAFELASALVPYLAANAVVHVTIPTTSGGAGLQRLPASLTEDEPTKAPATTKTLTGTLT